MAVRDYYVDSTDINAAGQLIQPQATLNANGSHVWTMFITFEVLAADSDGSVYRLFKGVPRGAVLRDVRIACDALTAGTDWDLGLYYTDLGAVIDKDIFMDGQTLATAKNFAGANAINGMQTVAIENYAKQLWEHAGHSETALPNTTRPAYDIALTGNTTGGTGGTVAVEITLSLP